jgi:hypothetical protein
MSSRGEHPTDDEDIIPIGEEANTNTLIRQTQTNLLKQEITTTFGLFGNMNLFIYLFLYLEYVEISYLPRCACQSHLATQLIDRTYSMSVDHLFDYIFGDNDFLVSYRASRRIKGSTLLFISLI